MHRAGTIERAFEIAPEVGTLDEVKRRLTREGYVGVDAHLTGPQIRRELTARLNPELRTPRP